jgi:hypothetical protein
MVSDEGRGLADFCVQRPFTEGIRGASLPAHSNAAVVAAIAALPEGKCAAAGSPTRRNPGALFYRVHFPVGCILRQR